MFKSFTINLSTQRSGLESLAPLTYIWAKLDQQKQDAIKRTSLCSKAHDYEEHAYSQQMAGHGSLIRAYKTQGKHSTTIS